MIFLQALDTQELEKITKRIRIENLVKAGVIILVIVLVLAAIRRYFEYRAKKEPMESGNYRSIYQLIKYFLIILGLMASLETIGIRLSVLLASMTALLVGVGLGIQQVFMDFTSGILLLFERNLKINDVVQLEDNIVGKVVKISLRTSILKTRDDIYVVVPNSKLVNNKIVNWSINDFKNRFSVTVGVSYNADVRKVEQILYDCAHSTDGVDHEDEPFVMFSNYGESSLVFDVFFYSYQSFRIEKIKSELRFSIYDAFKKEGIAIPYPQLDVHMKPPKF